MCYLVFIIMSDAVYMGMGGLVRCVEQGFCESVFDLNNYMLVPNHQPTHPRGWVLGWVDCILVLITAMMSLRRSLSKETHYVKPEPIKLCIYGDGRIVSGWVGGLMVWEPKTHFLISKTGSH